MKAWPRALRVQVETDQGVGVNNLLVGLRIRHNLRTYFSTVLGLTDSHGRLSVAGDALARQYAASVNEFPMDYKVKLEEWDDVALVDLGGGKDFETRRKIAVDSPIVEDRFRAMWRAAQNHSIASTQVAFPFNGEPVDVVLKARRVGVP